MRQILKDTKDRLFKNLDGLNRYVDEHQTHDVCYSDEDLDYIYKTLKAIKYIQEIELKITE